MDSKTEEIVAKQCEEFLLVISHAKEEGRNDINKRVKLMQDVLSTIINVPVHYDSYNKYFDMVLKDILEDYVSIGNGNNFSTLLQTLSSYFTRLPKIRIGNIVRRIIQYLRKIPNSVPLQLSICEDWIKWAKDEGRTLLRQRLELELSDILVSIGECEKALSILERLAIEFRKVDAKSQSVEVFLLESYAYRGLKNFQRARASLNNARTNATAVYAPPLLQAQLDLEAGILFNHEGEFHTAFSYFTEAFKNFYSVSDPRVLEALKYQLLSAILDNKAEKCKGIKNAAAKQLQSMKGGPLALNSEIDVMMEVSEAYETKKLDSLNSIINDSKKDILKKDPVVSYNLEKLVNNLMEQHLLRIVKPYSSIEISRIAELISLDKDYVLQKLVEMILDQKIKASIDQAAGILNIFEEGEENLLLTDSIELINNMDGVVDALYSRCKLLN